MNYEVAYDIQQALYPAWWVFGIGILMFAVGLGSILFDKPKVVRWIMGRPTTRSVVTAVFMCVFGSVMIGVGILNYAHFVELRRALRDGSVEIAEGKIEQFVPMPYSGHANETFVVNGHYFAYSDFDLTKGFNNTQSHGGPLKEGLQVRITHVNGSIVKLEIAR